MHMNGINLLLAMQIANSKLIICGKINWTRNHCTKDLNESIKVMISQTNSMARFGFIDESLSNLSFY